MPGVSRLEEARAQRPSQSLSRSSYSVPKPMVEQLERGKLSADGHITFVYGVGALKNLQKAS